MGGIPVLDDPPVLETFDLESQFIGFYGSYDEDHITSLGFLTHDPACNLTDPVEEEETTENEEEVLDETEPVEEVAMVTDNEEDDGGSNTAVIIVIVLLCPLIIGLAVGGVMLWKRRKRNITVGIADEAS